MFCVLSDLSRAQTLEKLNAICPCLPDIKIGSLISLFLQVFYILYSSLLLLLQPRKGNVSTH